MKNASVSAMIYEFLFEVERKMEIDRRESVARDGRELPFERRTIDNQRRSRQVFFHEFMSGWEFTDLALESVGVLTRIEGHFNYPTVALEECSLKDFSDFETFDNYCILMFYFHCLNWQFSGSDKVNLEIRSPLFLENMAMADDVFLVAYSEVFIRPRSIPGENSFPVR